jgi:hypothetical protein
MVFELNLNSLMNKNSILYLLPIYILGKIDMSQFIVFSSGLITGAYLAQNYNLPDVKTKLNEILEQMKTMEKDHNKHNSDNTETNKK